MSLGPLSAIVDIGSNSIRLVVYNGPKRAPVVLFNEKVLAGLGAALAETSKLSQKAMGRSLEALRRYRQLIAQMNVEHVRVVATAAVRDASNAALFLDQVARLGLKVEVLSGEDEARAAGYGVISAIPHANGIVGDLGGGSLELVRVRDGSVREHVSLPLGVLRLKSLMARGQEAVIEHVNAALEQAGWVHIQPNLPFYLVGGSWRALARYHIKLTEYPLSVLHHYRMSISACREILENLTEEGPRRSRAMSVISASRLPTLSDAAQILEAVAQQLQSSELIVSTFGLREGLLYQMLNENERAEDPLIAAARSEGARQGRFAEHGDLLNEWVAPLFDGDDVLFKRLRHAACLLADVSWTANPDFRAERGVDIALHGNWVGIDVRGRALIAQALFTAFGGGQSTPNLLRTHAEAEAFARAVQWGLAIRFGQRLSGGLAEPLTNSAFVLSGNTIVLQVASSVVSLLGDVVERRYKNLANAMNATGSYQNL